MTINKKSIVNRYFLIVVVMLLLGVFVIIKAAIIMYAEREYWQEVADRFVRENVTIRPNRGNILSSDGKLMASSLPEYRIYMDFMSGERDEERRKKDQQRRDQNLTDSIDSICIGLHHIFPDKSVAYFKQRLRQGRKKKSRHWLIYPNRISYIQYKEAKRLPVFRQGPNAGGFHEQVYNQRKKPFGSLAAQTLGRLYADTAKGARSGIELAFDSVLRGQNGITHRQKVMNRYLDIVDIPAQDGCDVVSTIDVGMQDICEKALRDELERINAMVGVAVLMEVKTGEVKAIVNLSKAGDGKYYEMNSNAISDLLEPGSTFKTASIMVALEDGKITPHTVVDTGNGIMNMHGSKMRDHNWHRGGYGKIDVTRILEVSSNIGVSYLIDKYYHDDPQKFVDGLKRMSLDQPLHLQIQGEGKPYLKGPDERYFAKTTLPWMSIGYETQLPPLNILTFYNAIANDGVMVRPKFVGQHAEQDPRHPAQRGEERPGQTRGQPGVFRIGQDGHGSDFQRQGGLQVRPRQLPGQLLRIFPLGGAQVQLHRLHPEAGTAGIGGGLMAGSVFGKIARQVFAQDLRFDLSAAIDSTSCPIPDVKAGELEDTREILAALDIPVETEGAPDAWGVQQHDTTAVVMNEHEPQPGLMPNVVGMGAKDAVYLLENAGLKVHLSGIGRVRRQSLPPGSRIVKGRTVALTLK